MHRRGRGDAKSRAVRGCRAAFVKLNRERGAGGEAAGSQGKSTDDTWMAAVGALTRVALADGLRGEEEGVRHDEVSVGGPMGKEMGTAGVVSRGHFEPHVQPLARH